MNQRLVASMLLIGFLLLCGVVVRAERNRVEVTRTTTAADDSKANSAEVPEGITAIGSFGRVFVLRFKYQTDLLAGIESMVRKHHIKNAVILNGIGSVRDWHLHAVSNRTFPSKNVYTKDTESPADIVSINGCVIDGRVHAHMTLAEPDGAIGGHLEPDTHVFTFAVVTLAELSSDMDVSRFDDKTYR
ncbi:MAG TPA: PPC domain-containing DNA-binding protein [Pirellulales bacterium]|jgi:predicted DNA-binding protein with PD1-like motif|nr:PPC domain-containing DNA-binding protein [Pirellulales bacterium]